MNDTPLIFRPGLFFYAFFEQPFTAIQDEQSSKRACTSISNFWLGLGKKQSDSDYTQDPNNPLNIPFVLTEALLRERLSRSAHKADPSDPVSPRKRSEPLVAAEINGLSNHRACIQSVHEMLTFRLCYSDEQDLDLQAINSRRLALQQSASGLTGLIGTVQVVFFEIGKHIPKWQLAESFESASQSLATSLGLEASREVVPMQAGHYLRRATLKGGRSENEHGDVFLLGFRQGEDQSINDLFYRRLQDLDLPRMVYYFLATAKTKRYYDEFLDDYAEAERADQEMEGMMKQSRKNLQKRDLVATELELEHLAEHRADYVRKIARLQRLRDIVVTNRWSQQVLARELFVVDNALVAKPLFNTGNFLIDDLIIAERNEVELKNKLNIIESFQLTQRTGMAFMQSQFRAVEAQHEEDFERRIHLLELFIVAVYGVHLVELYKQTGWLGLVIALIVGTIAAAYLYVPQLRTARSRRSIVSTIVVCLLLIILPLAVVFVEHKLEAMKPKSPDTPPVNGAEDKPHK